MTIEIKNGNELIVEGGLEAGFSLYTGYPGSPLADYFNILYHRKDELAAKGIRVVIANSEANAAAMASGAKQASRDCLVAMKSMGLHVAADALSVGNFADPGPEMLHPEKGTLEKSGVVVVVGDDPWSMSTSTPADSRYLFKHLHIPFLEPSTPQELKDWMKIALDFSRESSVYQGIVLTTAMAEGGGRVELKEHASVPTAKQVLDPATFDLQKNVMVPPNSLHADRSMILDRFPKVFAAYERHNLDQVLGNQTARLGMISSGVIYETLKQVLEEHDLLDVTKLYKLASSYPLIESRLKNFLSGIDVLIVVEEKRGFLEDELKTLIQKFQLNVTVFGKKFGDNEGFPSHGGLNYELIATKLAALSAHPLFLKSLNLNLKALPQAESLTQALPMRLPTFCPGCPHRETLSLLKDLRRTLKEEGIDLITHGDVGCYSLSFLPPFKEMHNLSAMGQGGALGAGLDLFSENPSVVLMGDSTFFHSGMTDISNSVQCGHHITYILLDNDNTAMTGHQMSPSTGMSVDGRIRPEQDMMNLVRALGVDQTMEVNPSDRYFYRSLLRDVIKAPGVKVIVSKKECALTFHGKKKAQERKILSQHKTLPIQTFYQINTDNCEDCRACVDATGCPGLTQVFDAYGSKVAIDPQICVSDSYCTKIKACPSFEQIDVRDFHPTLYQKEAAKIQTLELKTPELKIDFNKIAAGQDFRVVVTGVGGSGVTTLSRVLAEAAKTMGGRDDLDFKFVDQKGLAQRNGNVTAHLAVYHKNKSHGAMTPVATADLLLSPDLLDGSKHLQFLSSTGLLIVDESFQIPLSLLLDDGVKQEPLTEADLASSLKDLLEDRLIKKPFKQLAERALGKSVYASAMILGSAFQLGRLPYSEQDMKAAFERSMKASELAANWQAFALGRRLVLEDPKDILSEYQRSEKRASKKTLLEESLLESFLPWQPKKIFLEMYHRQVAQLIKIYPEVSETYLAQYIHDLYIYDRGTFIEEFIKEAAQIRHYYQDPKLWPMALRVLARTYWIKDEVYVSHLMISPMQRARDNQAYGKLGTSFQKRRINRPQFEVFGKRIEFDLSPKDWMLKIMRHLRILRLLLPSWHKKEKQIALEIRKKILQEIPKISEPEQYSALKRLENIKGYRDTRYEKAQGLVTL